MNRDIQLMQMHAEKGDVDAAWQLGYALIYGFYEHIDKGTVKCRKDKEKGVYWLRNAANRGCVPAMLEIGSYIVAEAIGRSPKDMKRFNEGLLWEKKAFQYGNHLAALNISVSYSMVNNRTRSLFWLKKAYKIYREIAVLPLAKAYLIGYGVRKDKRMAKKLFEEVIKCEYTLIDEKDSAKVYLTKILSGQSIDKIKSIFIT